EMESISALRKKVGCVRQENACLALQDEQLISDLDAMQATSKSQMSEQIRQLEAELEAQAKELAAELRAECCQEAAAHSDIVVATLTEELSTLREELENKTALGKRAEQQRNQALENAEKLKEAFKDYKATVSIKLKRVMESENKLKGSLIECDREKEELERSQLTEEVKQFKTAAASLQAQIEEAGHKASHLERQLMERGAECRDVASLRRELEDLRAVTHSQEQKVAQSQKEAQQSQTELAGLEAILALLHLREAGEGYQQLTRVLQSKEAERLKQSNLIERLQDRLSRAQEEISSLQSSMAQRASHYQSLHTELLDKLKQATDTEKELKKKKARVAALEKQLQEKTSAYSLAALKEKTSSVQHYQSLLTKKQREHQQSLEKCQQSHSHQFTEQQQRIQMVLSLEEVQPRVAEMEQELSSLQRERDEAQRTALLLQNSLDQLTQLQSSLSACRKEMNSYLQQIEEMKKNYETELERNKEEKLHSTTLVCQSSSEENLQLQLSLQQQQTMLTESSARVSELEESQSQLHRQHLTLEVKKCREELVSKESELERLRKDVGVKTSQISCMEESLQHIKSQLISKNDIMDLEKALNRSEADRRSCSQKVEILEGQLQMVQNELADTLKQLQELKDVLQKTQKVSDERQASAEKLTVQLETQRELEERTHEVLDMDNALRERQGELQQRAKLLGQLDVAIKEHKQELERKVESLQQSLEARERELRLESLQETRGQLLKVSEQISSTMRSSQEQLTVKLQQSQTQLEEESEVARLQARISSLGRAADRQHLYNHSPSISSLHKVTDSPQLCLSAPSPASS
uniref:Coiled-coil domain containing 18 n=1 Tax=Neolamprologus brichardi TaxID=32507 RepID=A0A3Q4M603_NEOBR